MVYNMLKLLRGKPTNVVSVKSDASYDDIMDAISTNQIKDKTLRAVVNACRVNPDKVIFVIYKAYSESVLFVFGATPVCVQVDGSSLQKIMMRHCIESRIYVFSYVK